MPIFICLIPLLALWWPPTPWHQYVRIARVVDGDTLDVWRGSSRWRVRLAEVDAPEKAQPLRLGGDAGMLSARCLAQLLERGRPWDLEWRGRDRYGRVLGELHGSDGPLGIQLIEAGCALPYHFVGDGPHRAAQRRRALERARRARRGMWGHGGIEDPYQWRRRQKTRRRPVAKE